MARVCEISNTKTSFGHKRRHQRGKAGGVDGPWSRKAQATNRTWRPNLTEVRLLVGGKPIRMRISMKTYKRLRKYGNMGNITLANQSQMIKTA